MTCAKYLPEYIKAIKNYDMSTTISKYRFAGSPVIPFKGKTLSNYSLQDGRASDELLEEWVKESPNRIAHLDGASQKLLRAVLEAPVKVELTVEEKPKKKARKKKAVSKKPTTFED